MNAHHPVRGGAGTKVHEEAEQLLEICQLIPRYREYDLATRLPFPRTLPTQPKPRTVAVVSGRGMYDVHGKTYGSQGFFEAAHALGVSLIVLGEPDHWLASGTYSHLHKDFIALDLSQHTNLPNRIAAAVCGRAIDGIVTFTDEYVVTTAEAAEILGLRTEPALVMWQAHHRHEMRRLLLSLLNDDNANNKVQAVRLHSAAYLDHPPPANQLAALHLRQAVAILGEDNRLAEQGIMLETYISAPELDANFVLLDRAVLFLRSATLAANFADTLQISNTWFPLWEFEAIREKLSQSLWALGFRSWVFHVDARMRKTALRYGLVDVRDGDGEVGGSIIDLIAARESELTRPRGTWSTLYTYGVDLGALQLLRAVNDRDRFRALSSLFHFSGDHHPGDGRGAQYWNAICMVYEAIPEIAPHVSRAELPVKPGTWVSSAGEVPWIGYLLVHSRVSRRHLLEMYARFGGAFATQQQQPPTAQTDSQPSLSGPPDFQPPPPPRDPSPPPDQSPQSSPTDASPQ
ncbi:hypothetical protein KXW33_000674 [Aspergillus fumigatus]|nr:hypothetical protein KXW33_000674 [Aspergillus fumigatus]